MGQDPTPNSISFTVNGEQIVVDDPSPHVLLGDFLRDSLGLKGLQLPCREGGCGGCTVLLSSIECASSLRDSKLSNSLVSHRPINSCLRPLCAMDGMAVTTVEGVGTLKTGLAPVQQALVHHNGSQCGFCTPGMVMSMYSLLKSAPDPTKQQVEDQLDGNLCRCTGYRPILDAFQTFSSDKMNGGANKCGKLCTYFQQDIEDLYYEGKSIQDDVLLFSKEGLTWVRVLSLSVLYSLLQRYRGNYNVRLVVGNTSTGVYSQPLDGVCIDISRVPDLLKTQVSTEGIVIGGAVPIAALMTLLNLNKGVSPSYGPLLRHLKRVASPQVRSVGSVAGNLMMVHKYNDFVSDIATILMAAEVKLKLASANEGGLEHLVTLEEFFDLSMDGMVILEIQLPALKSCTSFFTYKVALRNVNSHAIVNAAFKYEINASSGLISSPPIIVYGGIRSHPQRSRSSEKFLDGKSFKDSQVFNAAVRLLQKDIVPDPSMGRTAYRSSLVVGYFFKSFISLWPKETIPSRLLSVVTEYSRPISSGKISFGKGDPSEYPVSKAIPKLSAASQVTGDALYLDDLSVGDELHAVYVLSSVASASIKSIDPSKSLAMKGIVKFISAADTGSSRGYSNIVSDYESVFASDRVQYYGQALGLVVAKSKAIAAAGAKLVEVEYEDIQKPILTIEDAIRVNSFFEERTVKFQTGSTDNAFKRAGTVIVEGKVSIGHQYHFHLETQRALCIPGENGCMKVYTSTQNPSQVQSCVGRALNRQQHKITVEVKRVGGAYGAKLNRSASVAMACAIAADKVGRPVKLVLDLSSNMQLVGARSPYLCMYKVGAQKNGHITAIDLSIFNNQGAHFDFEYPDMRTLVKFIDNVYNVPNWSIKGKIAQTNLPACTYMRGPVFVEATFMLETAIEHVSKALGLRAEVVRELNMYIDGDVTLAGQHLVSCNAKPIYKTVKESSDYEKRLGEVEDFNSKNQWVKRGLSIIPIKFCADWEGFQALALVNVYPDGSISIHNSGCEVGQGLDIKVAQVAAMILGSVAGGGVSLEDIYVHTTTSIVANNAAETGGSVTSELCGKAVQIACEDIVERLKTASKMLTSEDGKPAWQDLISTAVDLGVDLQARGRVYPESGPNGPFQYLSFGAGVTEAEVDLLTGETHILRADLLLDCGKSLNPAIDIGQMQGAFVQGLGYHLSEDFLYDVATGKLLSDGTWEYKPPSSKDIPIIFNTALLPNSSNPTGFLRSKFSGEPPYGMACSALFAVRHAVASGRSQLGMTGWCPLNSPATVDKVALAAGVTLAMLRLDEA